MKIREEVYRLEAMNYEKAREKGLLTGRPYKQVLDLVLLPTIYEGKDYGSIKGYKDTPVTEDGLREMGVSFEEFYNIALQNTYKIAKITSLSSLFSMVGDEVYCDFDNIKMVEPPFFVLTDFEPWAGALIGDDIFLSSFKENIGDFIILPCTRDSIMVIPMDDRFDKDYLSETVVMVNNMYGQKENDCFLSDNIYCYDGKISTYKK